MAEANIIRPSALGISLQILLKGRSNLLIEEPGEWKTRRRCH